MRRGWTSKGIAETIKDMQERGWHLHTYTAAGNPGQISHYLLFEKGE
jgi:hypothetical protein